MEKFKLLVSYLFLFSGYIFLTWVTEICFDNSATEIGVLLCLVLLIFSYFVYIVINHLLINRVLSHQIPIIFEALILTFICMKIIMTKVKFFQSIPFI